VILRAVAVWLLLLFVALVVAVLRVKLLEPRVGELSAHVLGSLLVAAVFATLIFALAPWVVPDLDTRHLLVLGGAWTLATVGFEFGFGRLVMGHPWSRLLADYDLRRGRIWVLVLLVILVMPILAGFLRG
jgi:hypothetical protein